MRQSKLFSKTRKEAPKDEVSKNARLLIQGGFINKELSGVYSYLSLGLLVLKKIEKIIRQEMNAIGGQEVLMTTLQDPEPWQKSGRWNDETVDNWFKTRLHSGDGFHKGPELGIANTHEEPLTRLLKQHVSSYKDLPLYIYQFQNKFRNELRAKSGIMRGREFLMKDLYSFSRAEDEFKTFYETCAESYIKIFGRVGLGDKTFRTFASGGSFSRFSDEFQTLTEAGEDMIYLDRKSGIAINKEVYTEEVLNQLGFRIENLEEFKAIEVGNIFPLGDKFTRAIGFSVKDENGEDFYPYMGSYGIGLGRLMGAVVEVLSDDKGIIWPKSIAPFDVHLLSLGLSDIVKNKSEDLYRKLLENKVETLFDDRPIQAGEKFADSDLLGIPNRIIVSEKTISEESYELKERKSEKVAKTDLNNILKAIKSK